MMMIHSIITKSISRLPGVCSILILLWGLILIPSYSVAETSGEADLAEIEQNAADLMAEGHPENALEIYHYYEREIVRQNWDRLQIDLLHNKAVASYRSGKLAEAVAYAKQLYILDPTPMRYELKHDIEMLMEHRLYHKYPDMACQRGQSAKYALWEGFHRFSQTELRTALLISWSVLFLLITATYLLRKRKKIQIFFLCKTAMCLIFTIPMIVFNIMYDSTSKTRFGVIENGRALHTEADYDSKILPANAFFPGMTVEILSTVPGWVKVMRIDGETAWIEADDLYILRGKGDNHPAHFVRPSKNKTDT